METVATGKADRNKTVQELMGEVPRTGNRYLDLGTGNFISIASDAVAPSEGPPAPPEPEVKKKREKKR